MKRVCMVHTVGCTGDGPHCVKPPLPGNITFHDGGKDRAVIAGDARALELYAVCAPSQVDLGRGEPPLVGTLGRTEREVAAAILIRWCQIRMAWSPCNVQEIVRHLESVEKADREKELLYRWFSNPYLKPDFRSLFERGMVDGSDGSPILHIKPELLRAIHRWVRPDGWRLTP